MIVPYTFRNNDIVRFASSIAMTGVAFLQDLKDEFDVLYAEGRIRRCMISVSAHDRIGGSLVIVRALDNFISYVKNHAGVSFMHKDDIVR